jgi:hypothetical protein
MSARRIFPCLEIGLVWSGLGVACTSALRRTEKLAAEGHRRRLCVPLGTTVCLIDIHLSTYDKEISRIRCLFDRSACSENRAGLELPLAAPINQNGKSVRLLRDHVLLNSWGGGVRLSPLRTPATTGPTVPAPDEYGALCGMRIGRGNRSTRRKTASAAALSITNPTLPDLESKPGRLCCGTALPITFFSSFFISWVIISLVSFCVSLPACLYLLVSLCCFLIIFLHTYIPYIWLSFCFPTRALSFISLSPFECFCYFLFPFFQFLILLSLF